MLLRTGVAGALGAAALFGAVPDGATDAEPLAAAEGATCVTYEARAVFAALAYDHRVILRNGCEKDARCTVTTDVNPEPQEATVAKGESTMVVTFRGSPASTFTPTVRCALAD